MPRTDAASGPPSSSRSSAASRISSSVRARRGPRRRRMPGTDIGATCPLDVSGNRVRLSLYAVQMVYAVQGVPVTTEIVSHGLRRATGTLFVAGALAFGGAATALSSTFDWPDILREPADVVLPAVVAGGTSLVWTWFATAWTYAILLAPILLLSAALGRQRDPVLRVATFVGATSVVLSLIGFLRW